MSGDVDQRSKTQKQLYVRSIEVKLAEKKVTLEFVKRKIILAMESGRIHASDQLLKAEHQADACVAILKKRLDQLKSADDESWEQQRFDLEMAWDDLSQSIKKIVARFP